MKYLTLLLLLCCSAYATELQMEIFQDANCNKLIENKKIPLDKLYCDTDQMVGQYFMINCLDRKLNRVWSRYGDDKCSGPAPKQEGGNDSYDQESCHYDKVTSKAYKFKYEFSTAGALCTFQKCISECKKEENCKSECKKKFSDNL